MSDCIFCKIGNGSIPVDQIHDDRYSIAFADSNPQAPTHLLVVPKEHFADVTEAPPELLGHLLKTAATLGRRELPDGFRIVINTGHDGGQTVPHLHLHVLGGRRLNWPPG